MVAASTSAQAVYQRRTPEAHPLYGVLSQHLETFLTRTRTADRQLPSHVERELRAYLECGILAYGFMRVRCEQCGQSRAVAFSCKRRGFCPGCLGRRMADTAARLTDEVFPPVPVRQWVLSLPFELTVFPSRPLHTQQTPPKNAAQERHGPLA